MKVQPGLIEQFGTYATSTVSDALDSCGIVGAVAGFRCVSPGLRASGRARTAVVVDSKEPGLHGLSDFIDGAEEGDFLVLSWASEVRASTFGGLAAQRARIRGCAGLVVDGCLRDVDEIRQRLPAWFKSCTPRTGRGRLAVRMTSHPVLVGEVLVSAGDVVVADETGICFIPRERSSDVLTAVKEFAQRDVDAEARLFAGESFGLSQPSERLAGR